MYPINKQIIALAEYGMIITSKVLPKKEYSAYAAWAIFISQIELRKYGSNGTTVALSANGVSCRQLDAFRLHWGAAYIGISWATPKVTSFEFTSPIRRVINLRLILYTIRRCTAAAAAAATRTEWAKEKRRRGLHDSNGETRLKWESKRTFEYIYDYIYCPRRGGRREI